MRHAKFTGEVGVCLATSGPGAIHLLNGLYDAKLDHQPVVAIVGQQAQLALGGNYQQEVDLQVLFKDVAHEYVHMATKPGQVRHLVDRAMRIAKSERTVTCLILPNDLQEEEAEEEPPREHGTVHSGIGVTIPRIIPAAQELERAAEVLNEGERVAMLVGAGALGAGRRRSTAAADLLGAGVAKALLGKAGAARRRALGDRLDRPARDEAELGSDDRLRHAADGRLELPLLGVPPRGGSGPGRPDRPRRADDRNPLPDGGESGRRRDARRCASCFRGCSASRIDPGGEEIESGVGDWWKLIEARAMEGGRSDQPAARLLGALEAAPRRT